MQSPDQNEISLDGFEVVKKESFQPCPRPMMTIDNNGITFNREAVDALEGTEYIHVLINTEDKELVIVQSRKWDGRKKADEQRLRPSRWTLAKDGKAALLEQSSFCREILRSFEYKPGYRYCVFGQKIVAFDAAAILFDLTKVIVFSPSEHECDAG